MYSGQQPEAIDTRTVFRIYAALAALFGFVLFAWGPMWLGSDLAGQPWGKAALIRVAGSILIGAGCCAAGFAAVDDPQARRRGLFWFACGHAVVCLVVLSQRLAVWEPGLADQTAHLLSAVAFCLYYLWATAGGEPAQATITSLFRGTAPGSSEQLRSRYEQQIRQASAQEERNRLARDLHDSVKQQIFVIQTAAATAQARFGGDPAGAKEALDQIRSSAREAVTEMQAMLDQLRAAPLENAGLVEGLKKQCEALGFRTGAHVEFELGDLPGNEALAPGAQQAIFRVAQEAFANAARHARAGSLVVWLGAVRRQVELRIKDDGVGFDLNRNWPGMGIRNMHARAEEFAGEVELISRPGGGTLVRFAIPYAVWEPAGVYRKKMLSSAAVLVFSLLVAVGTKSPVTVVLSAMAAVWLIRYGVAYRRARELGEAL